MYLFFAGSGGSLLLLWFALFIQPPLDGSLLSRIGFFFSISAIFCAAAGLFTQTLVDLSWI